MSERDIDLVCIAVYVLVTVFRSVLLPRRWKLPLMHGRGYFMGVPVAEDFIAGAGRRLLRIYRASIVAPFARR